MHMKSSNQCLRIQMIFCEGKHWVQGWMNQLLLYKCTSDKWWVSFYKWKDVFIMKANFVNLLGLISCIWSTCQCETSHAKRIEFLKKNILQRTKGPPCAIVNGEHLKSIQACRHLGELGLNMIQKVSYVVSMYGNVRSARTMWAPSTHSPYTVKIKIDSPHLSPARKDSMYLMQIIGCKSYHI